jgi:FkbM family methyltransferase
MLQAVKRDFYEWARCTRHNLLHLRLFRVTHRGGRWYARQGDLELVFDYYPYLAFHDIEGYLQDGEWRIEPGMTVIDAGGCWGEFALYASKCVGPSGRVLMLEPDPANIAVARRIFELNGNPRNLEIIPAGLWKEPGKLRFSSGQGAQSSVVGVGESAGVGSSIEIDVESLASLAQRIAAERMDFVKMDIEGAELEAIGGAAQLPTPFRPRYAIASYHIVDGKRTADVLPQMFSQLGYQTRSGNERHLTTWAWPTESRS